MLLTHWFHCIKLPASVLRKDHPFHALFPQEHPPHLFFTTANGEDTRTLPGDQTQSMVWKTMTAILRKSYKGNAGVTVKKLLNVLNEFDTLDSREAELRRRLDKELESHGPRSTRFKRLKTQFGSLQTKRKALLAKERKLRDLGIK